MMTPASLRDYLDPGVGDLIHRGYDMKHASLLNPFNLNQEPAGIVNKIANPQGTRSTPICSTCHSDDITSHATVQWSNESQAWELASTFDQPTHCNHCSSACEISWLPLN
jgi:hypothetical protein